jgi:hypothetical protein
VLLLEIVRLANAKYDARRLEEDGSLVIRSTDLLRFGFGKRKTGSDHAPSRNSSVSEPPTGGGSKPDEKGQLRSLLLVLTKAAKAQSRHPMQQARPGSWTARFEGIIRI